MIHNLSQHHSLVSQFVSEIRDAEIQQDRLRFRKNMERLGEIFAYEISKHLLWTKKEVTTPLGIANCSVLSEQPVLATILRAGLGLHQGLLNFFDKADNAFISAFRKHGRDGKFEIEMEYVTCPDLNDRILIISDPMLATGASMALTIKELHTFGIPKHTHIVTAIACTTGIEYVRKSLSNCTVWAAAIDEELTAKAYIVPGLGDAGDLAYGEKMQE